MASVSTQKKYLLQIMASVSTQKSLEEPRCIFQKWPSPFQLFLSALPIEI
jgi:hypothetical protein